MSRTVLLFALVVILAIPLGSSAGEAASDTTLQRTASAPGLGSVQAFAPGQVLVRFKSDLPFRRVASLVTTHDATPIRQIADRTFTLSVPVGHEKQALAALASDPAVQYVSLNYRMTETPIAPLKLVTDESGSPAGMILDEDPPSCITDLWMSTTQQGERLQENMVPSGTAQVYAWFEYTECVSEAVRVQVFYLGHDSRPEPIFSQESILKSGSGIQGNKVLAWPYFEQGNFPVGRYQTILSLSPEGGWDVVKSVSWRVSTFPNDHWFRGVSNYQWPLHSTGRRALPEADINAPQAWDITTGSPDIIIAVVSTGADMDHPDLKDKIWTNRREIPDNGIDDDDNGCVDDIHGCEFFNGEANPDPTDTANWGTFTSGIAGAETNNEIGMAGVSWGARIMPIKVLRLLPGNVLGGYLADVITAIQYSVNNGARIIHLDPRVEDENVSAEILELLRAAIDDAVSQGVLVVAGAGDLGEDRLLYPAGFENVVAVGATDPRNQRSWFSNYGQGIDLVAPGELILSTCNSGQYCIGSGTSLAAAHVDGVASLIWSVNPDLTPAEVRDILRESATDLEPDGHDEEHGYGKLDAAQALALSPHHLWLRTANLDRLGLVFLLDNRVNHACQTVWNLGTGPRTWTLNSDREWLLVEGSAGTTNAPVPSDLQVCADATRFEAAGIFEGTLAASSTLGRHGDEVDIDVKAVFQPRLSRVRLPFIRRK